MLVANVIGALTAITREAYAPTFAGIFGAYLIAVWIQRRKLPWCEAIIVAWSSIAGGAYALYLVWAFRSIPGLAAWSATLAFERGTGFIGDQLELYERVQRAIALAKQVRLENGRLAIEHDDVAERLASLKADTMAIRAMTLAGKPLDATKKYKVVGWAPVSEEARPAGGEPVWDVVARYLRAQKTIAPRALNLPKVEGVAGNPGLGA